MHKYRFVDGYMVVDLNENYWIIDNLSEFSYSYDGTNKIKIENNTFKIRTDVENIDDIIKLQNLNYDIKGVIGINIISKFILFISNHAISFINPRKKDDNYNYKRYEEDSSNANDIIYESEKKCKNMICIFDIDNKQAKTLIGLSYKENYIKNKDKDDNNYERNTNVSYMTKNEKKMLCLNYKILNERIKKKIKKYKCDAIISFYYDDDYKCTLFNNYMILDYINNKIFIN